MGSSGQLFQACWPSSAEHMQLLSLASPVYKGYQERSTSADHFQKFQVIVWQRWQTDIIFHLIRKREMHDVYTCLSIPINFIKGHGLLLKNEVYTTVHLPPALEADPTVEGSILQFPNTVAELWGSWPLLIGVLETLQNDWEKTVGQWNLVNIRFPALKLTLDFRN